jgi:hypothetical protein
MPPKRKVTQKAARPPQPAPSAKDEFALATVQESAAYELMDQADTQLIIEELTGIVPASDRPLAYSFLSGGKVVTGLTVVGIQECVRIMSSQARQSGDTDEPRYLVEVLRPMGKPEFEIIELPVLGPSIICSMTIGRYAVDVANGKEVFLDSAVGTKAQPAFQETRNGPQKDPFFVEKAQSKAERNGKKKLIRADVAAAVLKTALSKGLVENRPPGSADPKDYGSQDPKKIIERADPVTNDIAWLKSMGEAKKLLGDTIYYKVIGGAGFEHANLIFDHKVRAQIHKQLQQEYRDLQEHKKTQSAKASGAPAASLFEREPGE